MYISLRQQHMSYPDLFWWCGRAGAIAAVVAWISLVITEVARPYFEAPTVIAYYQAAALAILFTGYAPGWRNELAGGVLAIIETVAFFIVHIMTFKVWPKPGVAWFAAPGALFLMAWKYDNSGQDVIAQPKALSQQNSSEQL